MSSGSTFGGSTGSLGRLYALAVVASFLGVQVAAQTLDRGSSFFPFVAYPMYSQAHGPGETIRYTELRLASAHPEFPAYAPPGRALGLPNNIYSKLRDGAISRAATVQAPGEDGAARTLARLLSRHSDPHYTRAEIWTREIRMGADGLEDPDVPWTLARSFELPRQAAR